jgi:hypothetical protein
MSTGDRKVKARKERTDDANEPVLGKLEDMDNKLERIKSDTHSLNRVACIANAPVIKEELWKAVGRSEVRAAILHLTKDEIGTKDLVDALGISEENLAMYMKPFLGNRGFIAELKKGRNKFFQRSEQVDLIGFEKEERFIELLESWKAKRNVPSNTAENVPPKEKVDDAKF